MTTSCHGKMEPVAGTVRTSSWRTTGVVVTVRAAAAGRGPDSPATPGAGVSSWGRPLQPASSSAVATTEKRNGLWAMRMRMEDDGYWRIGCGGNLVRYQVTDRISASLFYGTDRPRVQHDEHPQALRPQSGRADRLPAQAVDASIPSPGGGEAAPGMRHVAGAPGDAGPAAAGAGRGRRAARPAPAGDGADHDRPAAASGGGGRDRAPARSTQSPRRPLVPAAGRRSAPERRAHRQHAGDDQDALAARRTRGGRTARLPRALRGRTGGGRWHAARRRRR